MGRAMFPDLIGNETIKNNLAKDAASGRAAHAYILEGEAGSGRHLVARLLSASAVCDHRKDEAYPLPCGACPTCRRILGGISADVTVISTEGKATIGVDAIRKMKETLYVTPNDGDMKFYIIEDAHLMTVQAQNALLLSLEEPPAYVMFFLITTHAAGLLETIRSRAPSVRTETFSPKEVLDILRSGRLISTNGFSEDALREAAYLSGGSLGRAVSLLAERDGTDAMRDIARRLAEGLCGRMRTSELLEFTSGEMPTERESVLSVLALAMTAVRDLILLKKSDGDGLLFYFGTEDLPADGGRLSVKRLVYVYEILRSAHEAISGNGSVHTVLTELVLKKDKSR